MLEQWASIELDLDDLGHDIEHLLDIRSWRWFSLRVSGLISNRESRLYAAVAHQLAQEDPPDEGPDES